jgi:hypothetical protein
MVMALASGAWRLPAFRASWFWILKRGPGSLDWMPGAKKGWAMNPMARVEKAWSCPLKKAAVRAFWTATS